MDMEDERFDAPRLTAGTTTDVTPSAIREELDKLLGSDWSFDDPRFAAMQTAARKLADEFIETATWHVQDNLIPHLSYEVARWTEGAVRALLAGNQRAFEHYLGCQQGSYTGREHFFLKHESEFVAMRRKLAEAAPDLIRNERIADLEAIEAGLRKEIEERDRTIERLRLRLGYTP